MSRSYKKTPIAKSGGYGGHDGKKFAKRKLRRSITEDKILTSQRGLYKRNFPSWVINDYVCRWTKEDEINHYKEIEMGALLNDNWGDYCRSILKKYPTVEEYIYDKWFRRFKNK